MSDAKLCERCEAAADRQAAQMAPREVREGVARVLRDDSLEFIVGPAADIRIGDIVRVQLVAGAVEDMPWCDECDPRMSHINPHNQRKTPPERGKD
jgi:hypothetical protein